MRQRSFTGPLLLLLIGALFLWRNLHPEAPVFDLMASYWPFVLIAWGLLRLIEVLVWSRQGYGYGFTGGEVVLVVLICMAGSGIWAAHQHGIRWNVFGPDWLGEQYEYPISARCPAAGMNRIVFENSNGNIKVTGGDTQEVTVNGRKLIRAYARTDADRTNERTPVEIVPQGDRLLVRTSQDRAPDNQRISDDLEVTVPRGMAVEARGRVADYEIADISGDVELAAGRGDVRLARMGGNARLEMGRSNLIRALDVKGKIDVNGRGSDLEFENIAGQVTINGGYTGTLEFKSLVKPLRFEGARSTELSVQAVPGRINMDMGEFTARDIVGPVRLVSQSRDITIEQFTQSLELETQRGDIELQPGRLPLSAIEAHSGTGRIDLVLPDKAVFQLQATAERGEAINDFGPQIQRAVEGRTATLKGKVGEGPTIRLNTSRGSVSVRKEGTPPSVPEAPRPPRAPKEPKNLKETETEM
jgi:DUF4097 and DUF4098 domain-containing protein YvlB